MHRSMIVPGAGFAAFLWRQRARCTRLLVRFHADVSTGVVAREEAAAAWRRTFHLHTTTRDDEVSLRIVAEITNYLWLRRIYIFFADERTCDYEQDCWRARLCYCHAEFLERYCRILPPRNRRPMCSAAYWQTPDSSRVHRATGLSSMRIAAGPVSRIPSTTGKSDVNSKQIFILNKNEDFMLSRIFYQIKTYWIIRIIY